MSNLIEALTELLNTRAPQQELFRGTLGNGQGVVLFPALADYCYVQLRGSTASVVVAHNIQAPMQNGLAVDVERLMNHNQTIWEVTGLTQGLQFPVGTQPYANVREHAFTHKLGGYDPIYIRSNTVFVAGTYTMGQNDELLLVNTAAARAITLVDATKKLSGNPITIKDTGGQASVNNITLIPAASQTIDGVSGNRILNTNYVSLRLVTDGFNWFVV